MDVYDAKSNTIITSNDNNFPYSSSRRAGKADDNELLVLEVGRPACPVAARPDSERGHASWTRFSS